MRDIIDSEEPEGSIFNPSEDSFEAFDSNFPSHCPSPNSEDLAPLDAVQTFKLWQIFLDRVNPLIKIIHAPTIQPYIVQAAGDMSSIPLSYQGLLHSIFGVASIALSDDELLQILGLTRERASQKFLSLTFQPLARFDFLKRYDMVVLQALIHALVSPLLSFFPFPCSMLTYTQIILNSDDNRHAAWVLIGSLVRIAISMGYHRDGERLKLPPFETEMRRRIWWAIVTYDAKLTMACGFKHITIPNDFDTKPPLNLNDADLFPDASGELQSREGPTEMGFVLIIYRLARYFLNEEARLTAESNILGQTAMPDSPLDPQAVERIILLVQTLDLDLKDIERRFISATAGNAHAAALGIRPHIIARLRESLMPMQEHPEWGTEIFGPRDNLFKIMLSNFENITDALTFMEPRGFAWFIRLNFHNEAVASLFSLLYQRPTGTLSDRGWVVLERTYAQNPELLNLSQRSNIAQAQFALKAFDVREKAFAAAGHFLEVPSFIAQLRQKLQPASSTTATGPPSMAMDTGTPMSYPSMDFSPDGQFQTPDPNHGSLLTWNFWEGMGETGGGFGNGQQFPGGPF